ncbi:YheC/YheD family protein [Paenibacillus sp. N4]|uniref:YheC/YheD family endospore coat-associated protein n=1 Tax=Paenibacillus vietnamensis TaxID=2590547 RepID=UPI001CD15774|nr:YheC/YheD family protein [Paenibacillus vietnamensis]MCA0755347.1 YheC/YheD family protein [Paenibacillus vietnamensis]
MREQNINLGIAVASLTGSGTNAQGDARLPEPAFCRALSLLGRTHGADVYVFAADGFDPRTGELLAYRLRNTRWVLESVPLPDIVYNRCFFSSPGQRPAFRSMLQAMKLRKPFMLLGGELPAKLEVYGALQSDPDLAAHLPETVRYRSAEQLTELLRQHPGGIVLKPASGMQGKGIAHIARCPLQNQWTVRGRSRQNRPFSRTFEGEGGLTEWILRFTGSCSYIVQPYLELAGGDGKPFDVRALLQKDETGRWTLSGTAARIGRSGSITSNLHGGGTAEPALRLLSAKFGTLEAERLLMRIHTISKRAAETLESEFGRLAELGLDFGIEPGGRIWLLEANSKPGRSSFSQINDQTAEQHSVRRPLLYACSLAKRLNPSISMGAVETASGRRRYLISGNPIRPFNVQEVHR